MILPDVRFETDNLMEVIEKMEAYKLLFDTICLPTLLIGGHWLDDHDHNHNYLVMRRAKPFDLDGGFVYTNPWNERTQTFKRLHLGLRKALFTITINGRKGE